MSDDERTFSSGNSYIYDPGEDGMVFVNYGSGYKKEAAGKDFPDPVASFIKVEGIRRPE
ncbi:MAG: hypothetical protein AB7D05_06755 [Mangrovibacterium sp.]